MAFSVRTYFRSIPFYSFTQSRCWQLQANWSNKGLQPHQADGDRFCLAALAFICKSDLKRLCSLCETLAFQTQEVQLQEDYGKAHMEMLGDKSGQCIAGRK